jgi:hypothetical protein
VTRDFLRKHSATVHGATWKVACLSVSVSDQRDNETCCSTSSILPSRRCR